MSISVYLTSYNQKNYLIEAIESVLAQTLPPQQVIVVDDASSDGSQEMIRSYAHRYPQLVTPIFHTQNQGVVHTRRDALNAVTCEWVTYLDGDDRYLPEKLEKEFAQLQKTPNAKIAFSNNRYISADGKSLLTWAEEQPPPQGDVFVQTFARDYPRRNLFRMELVHYPMWKTIGFHDPNLDIYEDWDMRIRLTKVMRTTYCPEVLSEIRVHHTGLASSSWEKHLAAARYIYEKHKLSLASLDWQDAVHIRRRMAEWQARNMRRACKSILSRAPLTPARRLEALRRYLASVRIAPWYQDYRLLGKIILPKSLRERLRHHT